MRKIDEIILHCSDSEFGDVKMITDWHKQRGFNTIGYHFVILSDGSIEIGRDISSPGAHCLGHNKNSIGICLIGKNNFSQKQFETVKQLILTLKLKYKINSIVGHNHYDKSKTCPNFNVSEVIL